MKKIIVVAACLVVVIVVGILFMPRYDSALEKRTFISDFRVEKMRKPNSTSEFMGLLEPGDFVEFTGWKIKRRDVVWIQIDDGAWVSENQLFGTTGVV